jgi:heme-degrading monooxygenase HmoA
MKTNWKNTPPAAPFYAVIFISRKSENLSGYAQMDDRMMTLAQAQPGYLGYSSLADGAKNIFISYWKDQAVIENWRQHTEHKVAKSKASTWYAYYHSLICKVESHHEFSSLAKSLF